MSMITSLPTVIGSGCVGASDLGNGAFRIDFLDSSRPATAAEIASAKTISDADDAASTLLPAQRIAALAAYSRMQTIIDGADTATTAQLRAAVKDMAGVMRALIKLAAR
jgi:hypothetical protein